MSDPLAKVYTKCSGWPVILRKAMKAGRILQTGFGGASKAITNWKQWTG